jgi:CRP/FNR family transcriptional regulator, cyclic AMP receptor protein
MENLERILAEHRFLSGLDAKYISLLAGCASNVVFKAGEYVFHEGEAADAIFFIRHGKIILETFVSQKGPVSIQSLSEGDVFGWSWLIPPYQWHSDARAYDLTRAIKLDGTCLKGKCEKDHDLGYELMLRVAMMIEHRLLATRLQLLDVYGNGLQK